METSLLLAGRELERLRPRCLPLMVVVDAARGSAGRLMLSQPLLGSPLNC